MDKICSKCGVEKNVSLFGYHSQGVANKRPVCKACHSASQKVRYQSYSPERKDQLRAAARNAKLKKKFGINEDQYSEILKMQGGMCALCKRIPEHAGGIKLAVDHCHDTGVVRGLLCKGCNMTLGRIGDNAEALKKVLNYIDTPIEVKRSEYAFKSQWQALVARVADMSPDVPIYRRDLDRWLVEVVEAKPEGHEARAVNTTEYGRE